MKKILLFAILTLGFFITTNMIVIAPCDRPISYKIDKIDPQFNISREKFTKQTETAAAVWNKAYGKELFVLDPEGDLSVNLIYDERQRLNVQIVDSEAKLTKEQTTLDERIAKYKKDVADFEAKVKALNQQIEEWNNKGGAPPDVYDRLRQEQSDLKALAAKLDETAKVLKVSSTNFNDQVSQLNQNINTFNASLEERPEEGIYFATDNRIEIYFNVIESETIHTLAHELGHALRLDHNDNKKSIMYSQTTKSILPSAEDLASLKARCEPYTLLERIKSNLSFLLERINGTAVRF